jgi:hypothetical protein
MGSIINIELTPENIKLAAKDTKKWINNNVNRIHKIGTYYVRNDTITINEKQCNGLLNNVKLFYNEIDKHWAETDGESIWLNTWKTWTYSLLVYTLIHECIHGMIKRNGIHYIPEHKEHKIMEDLEPKLIHI